MAELKKQSVLILGATGSVGTALAERLAASGCHLMLAGRNSDSLQQLSSRLDCPSTLIDVEQPDTLEQAVSNTVNQSGQIDGVANCLGSVLIKPAHLTSDEEWAETIAVNLTSSFVILRSAVKSMRSTGGSIVLVSSAAAGVGLPNHEAIAAAKAGIEGLTRSAAATYASRGIRINAVAPGLVKSNMTRSFWEDEAAARSSIDMHALGRLGEPDDVASALEWLLNPSNSWVTGQVLGIDGGLATLRPRSRRK